MGIFGDSAGPRLIDGSWFGRKRRRVSGRMSRPSWALPRGAVLLAALALAGCAANDSGALLIDPGRYDVYKCDDLPARWKALTAIWPTIWAAASTSSSVGVGM